MTIVDLAAIIGAQLTLLLSIVAMKIYVRRTDVLSGRYLHRDTHMSAPPNRINVPDKRERKKLSEELARAISIDHLAFLNSLQLSFRCGRFLFVHAGIRPGVPVADQDEKDLLWIRKDFLGSEAPFGVFVVHGHTPVRAPEMRTNHLNIDTGAFATGRLTCAIIEGSAIMALSTETEDHASSARVQSQMAPPVVGGPATAP